MKTLMTATAALLAGTTLVSAGGIDRSGQFLGPLFESGGDTGSYLQFSFGQVDPAANTASMSDPLSPYNPVSLAYKTNLTDELSLAVIIDEPYGVNVNYIDGAFAGGSANIKSTATTMVLRYKINDNFSVHGGLRAQNLEGSIVSSAALDATGEYAAGYLVGAAYERPDIALRVAVTYNSSITNDFTGLEVGLDTSGNPISFTPVAFEVEFPESINVEFQTGIAQDTLLFGSIRYAMWDGFVLDSGLTEYVDFSEDTTTYSLGVGRRINENLALSASVGYEAPGERPSTTALAPTTGSTTLTVAATYTMDNVTLTGGMTYGVLGDQSVAVFDFEDNTVFGFGARVGFNF